jgi:large subunit ribosomal protein L15
MKLNEIKDNLGSTKPRKRIGRGIGSGKGKTSGKGHKGQKSRSGVSIKGFEGGQMPIHRRLPKRGFTNINRINYTELNLNNIQKLIDGKKIDTKQIISYKTLLDLGLVKSKKSKIKLLGKGDIKVKIDIEVSAFSKSAKDSIEKIGGSVIVLDDRKKSIIQDKKTGV